MPFLRIYLSNQLLKQIELGDKPLTLGRISDNDIQLNSSGVSSRHAVIKPEGHDYVIEDVGSTNGIFVNDKKIDRHVLKFWDEIQIYNYVLKFMSSAKPPGMGEEEEETDLITENTTFVASVETLDELRNLKALNDGYIHQVKDDGTIAAHKLSDEVFSIGKSDECSLQTHNWLGAKVSCYIERKGSRFYLTPTHWGRVTLNGKSITETAQLDSEDRFEVAGEGFYFRQVTDKDIHEM